MDIVALDVSLAMIIFVFRVEKVCWCAVIEKRVKSSIGFSLVASSSKIRTRL